MKLITPEQGKGWGEGEVEEGIKKVTGVQILFPAKCCIDRFQSKLNPFSAE